MLRPLDGSRPVSIPSAPVSRPAGAPVDQYVPGEPAASPDLRSAARLLDSRLQIDKRGADYSETAWCPAPDGTVYLGYSEARGTRGYVSSTGPDGAIRWELPFDEGRIREMAVLPDGRLAVATPKGVTVTGPDGRIQSREPAPAQGAWVLSADGRLQAEEPLRTWPATGDTLHEATKSWRLPDGDVLLQKRSTTTVWPRFVHGMEHDPMFGGQAIRTPDITVQHGLVRVSPEGQERWEVGDLGEKFQPSILSDGSACFVSPSGPQGRCTVETVDAGGLRRTAFQVPEPISDLLPGRGDTLLVRHGDTVSKCTPEGKALGAVALPRERAACHLEGEGAPGHLVFSEPEGRILWSCDLQTGAWSRLTDPVGDHSVSLTLENLHQESGRAPEVRQGEEWITIGGIRLPVRRG